MASRTFPTFLTDPLDGSSSTLDAKEYAALVAANGNFALENTPVTVAHTGLGTANALATTTVPAITAYAADQTIWLVPDATNTGAVTITRDGLPPRAIVDKAGDALTGGELVFGNAYELWDNGSHLRIMTPDASAGGSSGTTPFVRTLNADDMTGTSYIISDFTYEEAWLWLVGVIPASDNANCEITCSDDDAATFESSGYKTSAGAALTAAVVYDAGALDTGNDQTFLVHIERLGDQLMITAWLGGVTPDRHEVTIFDNGNTVDAIKIYLDNGSIADGDITMWTR